MQHFNGSSLAVLIVPELVLPNHPLHVYTFIDETHLEATGIQELGVVGGEGVVEAEGCHGVPGVVPLREHGKVSKGSEQLGHICDCAPNWSTNVTVQLQWNDARPAFHACLWECLWLGLGAQHAFGQTLIVGHILMISMESLKSCIEGSAHHSKDQSGLLLCS